MSREEIIKQLEGISKELENIRAAFVRYPTSQDLGRRENNLCKRWNALLAELSALGEHSYKPERVFEEKTQPLTLE